MKKSTEMKKNLESLKNSIAQMQAEGKITEAHAKLPELSELKNAIAVQEALEEAETEKFEGDPLPVNKKADPTVAFNKAILGKPLTEAEAALVDTGNIEAVGEQGGYLVPVEQQNQITELKRSLVSLKEFCHVIPVSSYSGTMPLEVEENGELIDFDEINSIAESDIRFGQVTWKLSDKGDIIPISNSLLRDEKANLTNFVGKRFAKKAVRTENKKIMEILATVPKKTGADYTDINKMLNIELDPDISATAIILTNQEGFDYLDNLVDGNGRALLTTSLTDPTKKMYKGRTIEVLSLNQMPTAGLNKYKFYIGSMSDAIAFFDRQAYQMAVSKEAGFTKNATYMRVTEAFDVKAVDTKAMVELTITVVAG